MYQPGGTSGPSGSLGSTATQPSEPRNIGSPYTGGQNPLPPGGDSPAASTSEQAGSRVGEIRGRARETVQQVSGRARKEASAALNRVKEQSRGTLDKGKNKAAEGLNRYAQAIRDFSHRLHEEGNPNVAGYADEIGNQLERVSHYLQEHDSQQLLKDLGNTVRRRPGLFLAGMFVGGLVAARFLKASSQPDYEEGELDRGEDWMPEQERYAGMGAVSGMGGYQTEGDVSGLPPDESMSRATGAAGQAGTSPSASQFGSAQGASCNLPGADPAQRDKIEPEF